MTEKELFLYGFNAPLRKQIREWQELCSCCRCYGSERCGEHAPKLRKFINSQQTISSKNKYDCIEDMQKRLS